MSNKQEALCIVHRSKLKCHPTPDHKIKYYVYLRFVRLKNIFTAGLWIIEYAYCREGGVAALRVLECSQGFGVAPRVLE